jgi:hypothetical protein
VRKWTIKKMVYGLGMVLEIGGNWLAVKCQLTTNHGDRVPGLPPPYVYS